MTIPVAHQFTELQAQPEASERHVMSLQSELTLKGSVVTALEANLEQWEAKANDAAKEDTLLRDQM